MLDKDVSFPLGTTVWHLPAAAETVAVTPTNGGKIANK
jgi:hypothetical protein